MIDYMIDSEKKIKKLLDNIERDKDLIISNNRNNRVYLKNGDITLFNTFRYDKNDKTLTKLIKKEFIENKINIENLSIKFDSVQQMHNFRRQLRVHNDMTFIKFRKWLNIMNYDLIIKVTSDHEKIICKNDDIKIIFKNNKFIPDENRLKEIKKLRPFNIKINDNDILLIKILKTIINLRNLPINYYLKDFNNSSQDMNNFRNSIRTKDNISFDRFEYILNVYGFKCKIKIKSKEDEL